MKRTSPLVLLLALCGAAGVAATADAQSGEPSNGTFTETRVNRRFYYAAQPAWDGAIARYFGRDVYADLVLTYTWTFDMRSSNATFTLTGTGTATFYAAKDGQLLFSGPMSLVRTFTDAGKDAVIKRKTTAAGANSTWAPIPVMFSPKMDTFNHHYTITGLATVDITATNGVWSATWTTGDGSQPAKEESASIAGLSVAGATLGR